MMIPHPMSITPEEAVRTIAAWYGVPVTELEAMIARQKSPATSQEHARVQFVFGQMRRQWESWFNAERLDLEQVLEQA